jgi:hypothetical protein
MGAHPGESLAAAPREPAVAQAIGCGTVQAYLDTHAGSAFLAC